MKTDTGNIKIEAARAFERGYLGLGAGHIFEDGAVEQMIRVLPAMVATEKDIQSINIHQYIDFCSIDNLRKVAVSKRLPETVKTDIYEWLNSLGVPLEGAVPKDAAKWQEQFLLSWVIGDKKNNTNLEREEQYRIKPGIEDRFKQVMMHVYLIEDPQAQ